MRPEVQLFHAGAFVFQARRYWCPAITATTKRQVAIVGDNVKAAGLGESVKLAAFGDIVIGDIVK